MNYFQPNEILEIGTSLGLATSALALGNLNSKTTTLEGCANTFKIAKESLEVVSLEFRGSKEVSGSRFQVSSFEEVSSFKFQVSSFEEVSCSRFHVSSFEEVSSFKFQVSSSEEVSSFKFQVSSSLDNENRISFINCKFEDYLNELNLKTISEKQSAKNPQPTTHNSQLRTQNPKPTTHNSEPKTQNPKPKTQNPQPTTHNPHLTTNKPYLLRWQSF